MLTISDSDLGSGNSQFAEDLYLDGFMNLTCVDYSAISIEQQRYSLMKLNAITDHLVDSESSEIERE